MSESGGSAELKAAALAAAGDPNARAWALGAEGERRVADALKALPDGWVALHDRLLYPGVTDSNIDHVVIGPGGIFMIDAKNRGGDMTVYRNFLYQHTITSDGQKQSTNLQSEVAKAAWIVKEMSSRLTVTVVPVLCLAGSRSHKFTSPQFVQDVSVVSVERLVEWLTVQAPRMPSDHQPAWVRQVMTEFPSTTTDHDLLAAMAPDVMARKAERPRVTRARASAGVRATAARPPTTRSKSQPKAKKGRGMSVVRALITLGALAACIVYSPEIGHAIGGLFTKAITPTTGPSASTEQVDCRSIITSDLEGITSAKLVEQPTLGCTWEVPLLGDQAGNMQIRLRTDSDVMVYGSSYTRQARESHTPVVLQGAGADGRSTTVYVGAGTALTSGTDQYVVTHDALSMSTRAGPGVTA